MIFLLEERDNDCFKRKANERCAAQTWGPGRATLYLVCVLTLVSVGFGERCLWSIFSVTVRFSKLFFFAVDVKDGLVGLVGLTVNYR
jgi:hypothetical protein